MKNIFLSTLVLFLSATLFAQDDYTPEQEVTRLNKVINIVVEQNDRLKREIDSLKKTLASINEAKKEVPVIKPSQMEIMKLIDSRMIRVDSGSFTMGCADEKDTTCYYWEKPAHKVSINTFYMSKFPVTQKEWETIMSSNPCYNHCPDCPVENVTWEDAKKFIDKLNLMSGKRYRLPTEAEWEYAARGGNKSRGYKYAGDNDIEQVAWYYKNSGKRTHPVGKLKPNELGLYDMTGNVWQWCSDWFGVEYYNFSPASNPKGPDGTSDNYKSCRGGSWYYPAADCRVSNRDRYPINAKDDDVGFRLARD